VQAWPPAGSWYCLAFQLWPCHFEGSGFADSCWTVLAVQMACIPLNRKIQKGGMGKERGKVSCIIKQKSTRFVRAERYNLEKGFCLNEII